ncbi:hypothetical protein Emed_006378 [Eimeria media]
MGSCGRASATLNTPLNSPPAHWLAAEIATAAPTAAAATTATAAAPRAAAHTAATAAAPTAAAPTAATAAAPKAAAEFEGSAAAAAAAGVSQLVLEVCGVQTPQPVYIKFVWRGEKQKSPLLHPLRQHRPQQQLQQQQVEAEFLLPYDPAADGQGLLLRLWVQGRFRHKQLAEAWLQLSGISESPGGFFLPLSELGPQAGLRLRLQLLRFDAATHRMQLQQQLQQQQEIALRRQEQQRHEQELALNDMQQQGGGGAFFAQQLQQQHLQQPQQQYFQPPQQQPHMQQQMNYSPQPQQQQPQHHLYHAQQQQLYYEQQQAAYNAQQQQLQQQQQQQQGNASMPNGPYTIRNNTNSSSNRAAPVETDEEYIQGILPHATLQEIRTALAQSGGDREKAVDLLLRQAVDAAAAGHQQEVQQQQADAAAGAAAAAAGLGPSSAAYNPAVPPVQPQAPPYPQQYPQGAPVVGGPPQGPPQQQQALLPASALHQPSPTPPHPGTVIRFEALVLGLPAAAAVAAVADSITTRAACTVGAAAAVVGLELGKGCRGAPGRRKALLIGINYTGSRAQLRGCINDAKRMQQLLRGLFGFGGGPTDMVVLTDDNPDPLYKPTRKNMLSVRMLPLLLLLLLLPLLLLLLPLLPLLLLLLLLLLLVVFGWSVDLRAMRWLTLGNCPGDALFFHYSGHGARRLDPSGIESDGFDETILPLDFESEGEIVDDEPLQSGCRLTAVMDSCHSGSGLDLPFVWSQADFKWKEETNPFYVLGDVQLFSGCEDTQTSADLRGEGLQRAAGGAMTTAFVSALTQMPFSHSYPSLMDALASSMEQRKLQQRPQLTSSQRFDFNRPFSAYQQHQQQQQQQEQQQQQQQ